MSLGNQENFGIRWASGVVGARRCLAQCDAKPQSRATHRITPTLKNPRSSPFSVGARCNVPLQFGDIVDGELKTDLNLPPEKQDEMHTL